MNGPHIRQATPQDADRLVDVYRSAYRENRELGFPAKAETATVEDIQEWLDDGRLYIAESDQQIIGAIRIEETAPERLKISRLGVHDDWKDHGVGSALLDHVEKLAGAEGYETAWLTTPETLRTSRSSIGIVATRRPRTIPRSIGSTTRS